MPPSTSPLPMRHSRKATGADSDEDERTNDLSSMLGSLKFPKTTADDYELAKVFKEKLGFLEDDEDAALHLAKALREFKLRKNESNSSTSRKSEDSKENDSTQLPTKPLQTTLPPLKPAPPPERSKTPQRSSKNSPKPWDAALDRRAATSTTGSVFKARGPGSVLRTNSSADVAERPARSESPLRRFFSFKNLVGTTQPPTGDPTTVKVDTMTEKKETEPASSGLTRPVGLSQTPRNNGVAPPSDLFTPVDAKKTTFDFDVSPPSTAGTFSFTNTPGMEGTALGDARAMPETPVVVPEIPDMADTPGMADTPDATVPVSCETGAHKSRRTTTTPAGFGTFHAAKVFGESSASFHVSPNNLQDLSQNPTSSFTSQGDVCFHIGGTSAKKTHSRMDKIKARRAKGKVEAPPIHVPPPNGFDVPSETATTPTADVRTTSGLFSPMDVDEIIQPVTPNTGVPPHFVQPVMQRNTTSVPHPTFIRTAVQPQTFSAPQPMPLPSVVTGFEFNIGATDKASTPSKSRARRTAGRKMGGSPTAGVTRRVPPQRLIQVPHMHSEQDDNDEPSEEDSETTTKGADIFCEGNKAYVKSLREEARFFYRKEDYKSSVDRYTKALKVHIHDTGTLPEIDDVRAVLLANRGAALMMMTAFEAAVHDCNEALGFISSGISCDGYLPSDAGPILKCKVLIRLGRSHLKLGNLEQAANAFQLATETEAYARRFATNGHDSAAYLAQTLTDATMGKTEIKQCRELIRQLEQLGFSSLESPSVALRRNNLQALSLVNTALSMSSGSMNLHSMHVAILAALKRWREVAGCCERLAAEFTRFDGAFIEDLAPLNPFPGVSSATSLDSAFFAGDESKVKKISSKKAVVDVVLRLPRRMVHFYIRALRLEERYQLATAAIAALGKYLNETCEDHTCHSWLASEKDKLERTMQSKDLADSLYVNGKYEAAIRHYSSCMLIDGEGLPHDLSSEGSNGGGKLHAVLHCNRAACYMSTEKYIDAIKDCSMALRIHTHYMKAMLRRSRCYVRLARYEEATAEYERYIQLVQEYQKQDVFETTSCLFDGPSDVTTENLEAVKMELSEVKRSQVNQENAARTERAQQEQRQRWYSETFGTAKAGDDAQSRREQWYSQQGENEPRRWDSFKGRGPHPSGNAGKGPSWRQYSYHEDKSRREEEKSKSSSKQPASPGSDMSKSHYTVLQLKVDATEAEIKKGYRLMALKYHPDKNQDTDTSDMFRRIKLAYDVLSDPPARRKYDAENRFFRRV